jgi:hypothetical protein
MTYTIDAILPDGTYAEDHGLSAEDIDRARINAPKLGIKILAVIEETPLNPAMLGILLGAL